MDATKRSTQTVIVSGKGNKKNEAFASALNDVSKKVLKEAKKLIDGLPQDIEVLEQNSADKIKVFKEKIEENTQKTIFDIEKNVDRAVSIEEKKISNLITEKTSHNSMELAKQHILKQLDENPELHNQFILNSLNELDKVKL